MRVWLPYQSLAEAEARLGGWPAGIEVDVWGQGRVPSSADEVVYLAVPNYAAVPVWDQIEAAVPRLRWVQLGSAGFEHMLDRVPAEVGLCNAAGVHDAGTAELAVGLALAALRGIDKYAVDRLSQSFAPIYSDSLADKRVLIVGYGHIGSAIERRLAGFEVASVTRVARHARIDPPVHAADDLPALVGRADVIFLAVPGSAETEALIGAELMALMPDNALIVNVGRGVLVDTNALVGQAGRIRAALDVTEPEPLPPDHPLWTADYVTWTPHIGGFTRAFEPRYDALLHAQLARLANDEPLLNVVRSPA